VRNPPSDEPADADPGVDEERVREIKAIKDPLERAVASHSLITAWNGLRSELIVIRREALRELSDDKKRGMNGARIARLLGVTQQRVQQLIPKKKERRRQAEKAAPPTEPPAASPPAEG
jgi:hypothetical protein